MLKFEVHHSLAVEGRNMGPVSGYVLFITGAPQHVSNNCGQYCSWVINLYVCHTVALNGIYLFDSRNRSSTVGRACLSDAPGLGTTLLHVKTTRTGETRRVCIEALLVVCNGS